MMKRTKYPTPQASSQLMQGTSPIDTVDSSVPVQKRVICDFNVKLRDYSLTFRDRASLKSIMAFLKSEGYEFYMRTDGKVMRAELEIGGTHGI